MLSSEAAARVPDLFAEAQSLPSDEQAAFLARACAGDNALREEVASLLRVSSETRDFLSGDVFDFEDDLFPDHPTQGELQPGDLLGDCRIISLLGVGGMGEVYLADDTALGRRVAVKLLSAGRGPALLRHFQHERKVLAALNHPHIARLYNSAVTPEGRAYLVMEYVEGERLDEYCARHALGTAARLALFRKACAAVSYAHQNLVVHRDLKPANIRVTPEGEPKLLDFGIAKLLETQTSHPPGAEPTLTLAGAMTPEYASPEQLRGEPITTATDVYSLGVVLYELLAGQRPYRLKSRRPEEMARVISEQEPERPSTVRAATESSGQSTRRRELAGDLDNIVAMAMRKEPTRRYASVAQFSEDIRRHGDGLPVMARRDTLAYRTGKFVRRNKTLAAAAVLVALSLVGGLAATAWQAHVAGQERDRARLAQKQAERMNDFLQTLLGSVDPSSGPGRDLTVVQVLDQASRNLDQELAGEPAILAQAHLTIGQAYASLKQVEPAVRHLRAALKIDLDLYGNDHPATAHAQTLLGVTLMSLVFHYQEASPLLLQAYNTTRRLPPDQQRDMATILEHGSNLLGMAGRHEEAQAAAQELVALSRREHGEKSDAYVRAVALLGDLHLNRGNYASAEKNILEALAICRQLPPTRSLTLPRLLNLTAYTQALLGKLDSAHAAILEARKIYGRTVGEDNVTYQSTFGVLGWIDYLQGNYVAAEAELRQALKTVAPQLPRGDQDVVGGTTNYGMTLIRLSRPAEAEPYLRDCLELAKANHLVSVASPTNVSLALGECLLAQKRYAEAEGLLLAAHEHLQAHPEQRRPEFSDDAVLLHELYTAWGKPATAALYPASRARQPDPALVPR